MIDLQRDFLNAAKRGDLNKLSEYLMKGVNLDIIRNKDGSTALHLACQYGHVDFVKILVDNKAAIESEDDNGLTPLQVSCENGHVECIKILILNKANINHSNKVGWRATHYACYYGHSNCLKILIDEDVNTVSLSDHRGLTALHYASRNGHSECVQILIDNNANVNQTDEEDWTALHSASKNGRLQCLKILIDNGANIHKAEKNGWTALHCASHYGYAHCLKLLIENKADVSQTINDGSDAFHLAEHKGHTECLNILTNSKADSNNLDNKNPPNRLSYPDDSDITINPERPASLLRNGETHGTSKSRIGAVSYYLFLETDPTIYYDRALQMGSTRGICLIIDNEHFQISSLPQRIGTQEDSKRLETVFTKMGYKVVSRRDCESMAMINSVREVSEMDHSNFDSLVICILSHGCKNGVFGVDGHVQEINDLVRDIKPVNCPSLKGKPKIILIQACRGTISANIYEGEDGSHSYLPNYTDFLFCYATVEKHVAYRTENGSPFIRVLCRYIEEFGRKESILDTITRVIREVAENKSLFPKHAINPNNIEPCQTVEFVSRLTKLFKF